MLCVLATTQVISGQIKSVLEIYVLCISVPVCGQVCVWICAVMLAYIYIYIYIYVCSDVHRVACIFVTMYLCTLSVMSEDSYISMYVFHHVRNYGPRHEFSYYVTMYICMFSVM